MEWCLIATAAAQYGDVYQFRVTANGVPLTTYTVTPQWTIGRHFGYRRAITIYDAMTPAGCPSSLSDFPVLVSYTDATLKTVANGGHVQNASGYDIIFRAADGVTNSTTRSRTIVR